MNLAPKQIILLKGQSENGAYLTHTTTEFVCGRSHLVQDICKGSQQSAGKTDRTFSYIYSHPNSYEPPAQICTGYKGEGTQSETNAQHIHYFHCDQIGVPREMTDEAGNLLWYADYKGWGGIREAHNLKDAHQPFRLQNQYVDEETGLHYNFFRYYDPHIGRFTQQDPIGLAGGENVYQFAANTQGHIDVLGLSATLSDFEDEVISPLPSWDKENKGSLGSWGTVMVGGVVLGTVGIISSEQVDSTESQSTTVNISSCSEKEKRKRCKKWGVGNERQAQMKVIRKQAPRGIKRVDEAHGDAPNGQWHAHDLTGAALNVDGTIHDKHRGVPSFGKDERDFLFCHGWNI